MKEWLVYATEHAIVVIDAMAFVIVVAGTIEAFVRGFWAIVSSAKGHEQRDVWLRYARWLVAGLTFQLAADIIETSITTSWEAVGRIAAVALIRTFLNYFLDRDLEDIRNRQREGTRGRRSAEMRTVMLSRRTLRVFLFAALASGSRGRASARSAAVVERRSGEEIHRRFRVPRDGAGRAGFRAGRAAHCDLRQ